MAFAVFPVNQAGFNKGPDLKRGAEEFRISTDLTSIEESDCRLGLRPPKFAPVGQTGRTAFIENAAVGVDAHRAMLRYAGSW